MYTHRARLDPEHLARLTASLGNFSGMAVTHSPGIGWVLVGGEYRFVAHQRRGDRTCEFYVLRTWDDLVAWMIADRAFAHRFRQAEWNAVDAAYYHAQLLAVLKPGRGDRPAWDVAEFTGQHYDAVRTVRGALKTTNDPDELPEIRAFAREQLELVAKGEITGHSVDNRIRAFRKVIADRTGGMSAAKQAQLLDNAVAMFTGIGDGFEALGKLHPDLTAEQCERWMSSVGAMSTELFRLKRQLRERISQHDDN